jgi:hypothetical protein
MVALKSSGIWDELGNAANFKDALDVSYPPFAFNSGMWTRDVHHDDAVALGLIADDTAVEPADVPDFNESVQSSYEFRDARLRDAILKLAGDAVEFVGGILRLKA